jgi:hypothetical protein
MESSMGYDEYMFMMDFVSSTMSSEDSPARRRKEKKMMTSVPIKS